MEGKWGLVRLKYVQLKRVEDALKLKNNFIAIPAMNWRVYFLNKDFSAQTLWKNTLFSSLMQKFAFLQPLGLYYSGVDIN